MDKLFGRTIQSREVSVGDLRIGGTQPIRVQSMTNTNTLDTRATVDQAIRLVNAGCEIVRITAPGIREAENLASIKKQLRLKGINVPLVADIHFNPKAAEIAAQIVEKVRINPGNYTDRKRGKSQYIEIDYKFELEKIAERIFPLLKICKENGTSIRIGTNHGSLSERILSRYGNTPEGMVASAMEFIEICRQFNFHELVLSMKASKVSIMKEANELLVEKMIHSGFRYPLHLGVTEAGNGPDGRIKAAAGIGSLLSLGIGDTIRVSLTEEPEAEIPVAKMIVEQYGKRMDLKGEIQKSARLIFPAGKSSFQQISGQKFAVVGTSVQSEIIFSEEMNKLTTKTGEKIDYLETDFHQTNQDKKAILKLTYAGLQSEELMIRSAADFSVLCSSVQPAGIWIVNEKTVIKDDVQHLSLKILQAMGLRFSEAEFIACPSCGRTQFNLMQALEKVKEKTAQLKGLRIAVMGCIVNGPGEMADADYGYVGSGYGKVTLYKGAEVVGKNIDENVAVDELVQLIRENEDWKDSV